MAGARSVRVPAGINAHDIDVRGVRTRVFEVDPGTGGTLRILLHGGGLDSALVSYGSALGSLGRCRRVIAPDLPGYGDSEFPSDSDFSIPWYGDWVVELIRALGFDRVDLGGLSLGGWITLAVAVDHPEVVRRIVAINPGGITEKFRFMRTVEWVMRHSALQRRINRLSVSLGPGLIRLQLRAGLGMTNPSALTDDLIDALVVSGKRPRAGEAFTATQRWALAGPANLSLVAKLPQIKAETLILAGRDDKLVPVADSVAAAHAVPNGRLRVLEPCGHWLVRDRPAEFVDAVNQFLDAAG